MTDSDHDGIADEVEAELLTRFRPYYKFSYDLWNERYRPTDPIWYIRHSELLWDGTENYSLYGVIPNSVLATDPLAVLSANRAGTEWGPSDLIDNPIMTKYYINVLNGQCEGYREGYCDGDGYDWPDVISLGNVGLFGHVTPYGPLFKIEYWQFFGYSDTGYSFDIGDHEGDWCVMALLYDPTRGTIEKIFHYSHGKEIAYEMVRTVETVYLSGDVLEFRGPNYSTDCHEIDNPYITAAVQNNLVRLFKDPQTEEFTHPIAYIERGTHELWPSEHWCFHQAPKHNGDGYPQFLTSSPPNLGEFGYFASDAARIILSYNGKWGAFCRKNSPPYGPTLHSEWTWIEGDTTQAKIGWFEDGATSWHTGPPVARIGEQRSFECEGSGVGTILLDGSLSYDRDGDGDIVFYEWSVDGSTIGQGCEQQLQLSLGRHKVSLLVRDNIRAWKPEGIESIDTATVTIVDTDPPEIAVELNRGAIWPPNHKMADVTATVAVTDVCCENVTVWLDTIYSNESENGKGDGNTNEDIQDADFNELDLNFNLRSERSGREDGRVYTIIYTAEDCSGNVASDTSYVRVPHTHTGWAWASQGFAPGGTVFSEEPGQQFAIIIPSNETFDATAMNVNEIYLGNIYGVVQQERILKTDANQDNLRDLTVFYSVSAVSNLRETEPIGLLYTSLDGVDYLVPNIFELGEPVPLGMITHSDEIRNTELSEEDFNENPGVTALLPNFPNPFNPSTTISFSLMTQEHVSLRIYSVQGTLVRILKNETFPGGLHNVIWDGRDNNSQQVASGIYFVRFAAGDSQVIQKIVLIR